MTIASLCCQENLATPQGDLRRSPNAFDSPLPQHFTVLGYDQRGLGQTDRPDIPYTMADYAKDATALLDAVGWERCAVIGISFEGAWRRVARARAQVPRSAARRVPVSGWLA